MPTAAAPSGPPRNVPGVTALILASASPARLNTLRNAGIEPEVIVSNVDESVVDSTDPAEVSGTLARLKAEAVAAQCQGRPALVLGCDSVLAFDSRVLGKPADAADARARWQRMRGRAGVLHTGHCLIDTATGKRAAAVAATTVHFADVSDAEIDAYVATGEPDDKAGAYAVQGAGGSLVSRVDGCYTNVVGLPLRTTARLLQAFGLAPASI